MKNRKSSWLVLVLVTSLLPVLSGCKISTPFRGPATQMDGQPGQRVVVALTRITLGDDPGLNQVFWDHTKKVLTSIEDQPGYLGHSVRRELFGKRAWTQSAWESEPALEAFVRSNAHRKAMQNGMAAAKQTGFARIVVERRALPLSWTEAERILQSQNEAQR